MPDYDPSSTVAFHPATAHRAVLFGDFRFDVAERVLTRNGAELHLPPRALALLEYLVARPGRIVSKQELMDVVWRDAFVSESSLTEAMGVLRQALGDSASQATFIQTVHRRGYRFVAPVRIEAQPGGATTPVAVPPPGPAAPEPDPAGRRPGRAVAIAAALATAVIAALAFWLARPVATPPPRVTRTTITLPANQAPAPGLAAHPVVAISPDGSRIVYVAGSTGQYRLYLRALDQFEATPLPGTEGGHGPFFSPDGSSIGFFRNERLLAMTLPQGQVLDLADAGAARGGWWHTDDTILYATGGARGLMRVPAQGGAATSVAVADLNPASLRNPSVSTDGGRILATHWRQNVRRSEVVSIDVRTGAAQVLGRGVHPRELPGGFVAFIRGDDLVAIDPDQPDAERTLLTDVMTGTTGAGQYAIGADGTLVYLPHLPARRLRQLRLAAADGAVRVLPLEQRPYQNLAVSPDGQSLAVTIHEQGAADLWVGRLSDGALQRLTTEGGAVGPVWSADGRTLFFASSRTGRFRVHRMPADGSGDQSVVIERDDAAPTSARADGVLLIETLSPDRGVNIVRVEPDGRTGDWLATPANEGQAKFSPDGRWVAYQSDVSGRFEVYVRAADKDGAGRQISTGGGGDARWSPDGRALHFTSRPQSLRVEMREGRPIGSPALTYESQDLLLARPSPAGLIVLASLEERRPLVTLNVVVNWVQEVRSRLAGGGEP